MATETAVGIDLGTTNSCVAVLKNGVTEVIPNEFGERTTPSMVIIAKDGKRYVGQEAKLNHYRHIHNTIYESKRLIGRKFDEECIQDRMLHWSFKVVEENGNPKICVSQNDKTKKYFYPEEISGIILEKMKCIAENYLGHPVQKAVVTVPAYFNDNQRQATIDAARIAGLEVLKIMNEPTAAAFAYILRHNIIDKPCTTLVFDLGGGTFDVSIINTDGKKFRVVAVNGDPDLGGADFDILLYNEIVGIIRKQAGENVNFSPIHTKRIKAQCIDVKEQLSEATSGSFDLPSVTTNGFDFEYTYTRENFEKLIKHLLKKIMKIVKATIAEGKLTLEDIDNIVLVGGSSKIPIVRKQLQDFFKKDLSLGVNPDEAVACGAAYQAAILNENPDAVVKNVAVVDVTPFPLGIEAEHVKMDILIKKNTPLPATFTKIYTTVVNNQTALRITVYQGEDELTSNNTKLGYFDLTEIPPAPARVPKIYVTFDINTNGVLHVTACEKSSNKTKNMKIVTNTGRISPSDFVRIIQENNQYNHEQEMLKKVAAEKNELLKFCLESKRSLKNSSLNSDKDEFVKYIQGTINELENLLVDENALPIILKKKEDVKRRYRRIRK